MCVLAGAWHWFSTMILPYIVDWLFVLFLGIFMALVSFIIDYFIEQIRKGYYQLCMCDLGVKFLRMFRHNATINLVSFAVSP